ncbi:MAG: hypothetical protein AAF333_03635 [Planctomycetota bacterium]
MLFKLFFVIAGVAVIAAALLSLEQRRLLTAHAMADLHVQMDSDRKATWDAQAQIAEGTHPVALRAAVERIGLDLEPLPAADPASGELEPAVAWPGLHDFEHAPPSSRPLYPPADDPTDADATP